MTSSDTSIKESRFSATKERTDFWDHPKGNSRREMRVLDTC